MAEQWVKRGGGEVVGGEKPGRAIFSGGKLSDQLRRSLGGDDPLAVTIDHHRVLAEYVSGCRPPKIVSGVHERQAAEPHEGPRRGKRDKGVLLTVAFAKVIVGQIADAQV